MNTKRTRIRFSVLLLLVMSACLLADAQPQGPGPQNGPPDGPPDFLMGPPGFGGPGGPGRMGEDRPVVKQFDRDGDGRLNPEERKAAREFLVQEARDGGRRRGGPPFGRREGSGEPPKAGLRVTPADVKAYPEAGVYDANVFRTFFLDFENADWEKELADFNDTDVEVPARLTIDGKTFPDVGVHFRGMSSYAMVGEGWKRSLNLSLDWLHKNQQFGGYRTFNLLNGHEDPTFLRAILYFRIAQDYLPAPKANLVRVVINGENWGVYESVQQFNKDFVRDYFGTTKGARWKVPGSPGGRGSLEYLGEDPAKYRGIYTIKSKDEPKAWAALIQLCRILHESPADRLEAALEPVLDVEGALKFLALENALVNNDGYWIRSSDYGLYLDEKGRFHLVPQDANETFMAGGGPGGPGGPGGFGPGMIVAGQVMAQGDQDGDGKVSRAEFTGLAERWYDKLDPERTGKVSQEAFLDRVGDLFPPPPGFGPGPDGPGGPGGPGNPPGRGGFGPARFLGPGLFAALDGNRDGTLLRAETRDAFDRWADQWDAARSGTLTEEKLREGFAAVLPAPGFGGPGRDGGGRAGGAGRGGFRGPGGPRSGGITLDPLVSANDESKPLLAKLLAVPALRTRYLGYIRDIAERWLDWEKLGPIASQYHALIADAVKEDTRKLGTTEAFENGLTGGAAASGGGGFGGRTAVSIKAFADQRRAFLLKHPEIQKLAKP